MCSALSIIVCPFHLVNLLSVLFWFTSFDEPFGIVRISAQLLWKESLNSNNKKFHLQFKEFKKITMHVDRDQKHSLEQVQTYGGVKLGYVCLTHRLTKFNALTIFFFFGTLPIKQWFVNRLYIFTLTFTLTALGSGTKQIVLFG